jgi:hypothetical protein
MARQRPHQGLAAPNSFGNGTDGTGRRFGSRPIYVLTSGNHGVGHPGVGNLERKLPDTPEHLKYKHETALTPGALARTVFER